MGLCINWFMAVKYMFEPGEGQGDLQVGEKRFREQLRSFRGQRIHFALKQ